MRNFANKQKSNPTFNRGWERVCGPINRVIGKKWAFLRSPLKLVVSLQKQKQKCKKKLKYVTLSGGGGGGGGRIVRFKTTVDLQVAQNIEFLNFSNTSDFLLKFLELGQRVKSYRPLNWKKCVVGIRGVGCKKSLRQHFWTKSAQMWGFWNQRTRSIRSSQFCLKILNFEKVDFSHFSHGKFLFPFKANTSRGAPLRLSKFQLNPFVGFLLANSFMNFWLSVRGSEKSYHESGFTQTRTFKKGHSDLGGEEGGVLWAKKDVFQWNSSVNCFILDVGEFFCHFSAKINFFRP